MTLHEMKQPPQAGRAEGWKRRLYQPTSVAADLEVRPVEAANMKTFQAFERTNVWREVSGRVGLISIPPDTSIVFAGRRKEPIPGA